MIRYVVRQGLLGCMIACVVHLLIDWCWCSIIMPHVGLMSQEMREQCLDVAVINATGTPPGVYLVYR